MKIIAFLFLVFFIQKDLAAQYKFFEGDSISQNAIHIGHDLLEFHRLSTNHNNSSYSVYSRNASKQRLDSLYQKRFDSPSMQFNPKESQHYDYDEKGRLKEVLVKNIDMSGRVEHKKTYEYDPNGNLIEEIEYQWDFLSNELHKISKVVSQYNPLKQKELRELYLWDKNSSE